jgi:hypothetical protein
VNAEQRSWVHPAIMAAGIVVGGMFVGAGFSQFRAADRYVTVKGVSEREARADLAIWPLHLSASSNELAPAYADLQASIAKVRQFLVREGIDTASLSLQGFGVTDLAANPYGGQQPRTSRYVIKQTIVVRSTNPDVVARASQRVAELVSAGVVFSSGEEYGARGPTFVFSGLNDLKPQMIAEATARAREGAEQFARDSRSTLGKIRTANQGVFSILARDAVQGIPEASQMVKTVRVVATVEYFLKR